MCHLVNGILALHIFPFWALDASSSQDGWNGGNTLEGNAFLSATSFTDEVITSSRVPKDLLGFVGNIAMNVQIKPLSNG